MLPQGVEQEIRLRLTRSNELQRFYSQLAGFVGDAHPEEQPHAFATHIGRGWMVAKFPPGLTAHSLLRVIPLEPRPINSDNSLAATAQAKVELDKAKAYLGTTALRVTMENPRNTAWLNGFILYPDVRKTPEQIIEDMGSVLKMESGEQKEYMIRAKELVYTLVSGQPSPVRRATFVQRPRIVAKR